VVPAIPRALQTRDGGFSVAALVLKDARRTEATTPITWADALRWGANNKVALLGTEEEDLAAINAARHIAHLPAFTIIEQRGVPAPLPRPGEGVNFAGDAPR
jgi:hypothetical protein